MGLPPQTQHYSTTTADSALLFESHMTLNNCCICFPLRCGVFILSVLTLAAVGYVPTSFTSGTWSYTLNWWISAILCALMLFGSLWGFIGTLLKDGPKVYAYYQIYDSILFIAVIRLILSIISWIFNFDRVCETMQLDSVSQCRNALMIWVGVEVVFLVIGFYFAYCIYSYAIHLLRPPAQP